VSSGSVGGNIKSMVFVIDCLKSDGVFLENLINVNSFLETNVSKKGSISKPFIIDNGNGTYNLILNDSIPETFNLKKPYKIRTMDIFTYTNFDIMISVNAFIMKTYVNYMLGLKLLTNTILYNKTIYDQYNIDSTLKIGNVEKTNISYTDNFKKWGAKKSETIDNIMNILQRKNK
jgi:hypothetical protein